MNKKAIWILLPGMIGLFQLGAQTDNKIVIDNDIQYNSSSGF